MNILSHANDSNAQAGPSQPRAPPPASSSSTMTPTATTTNTLLDHDSDDDELEYVDPAEFDDICSQVPDYMLGNEVPGKGKKKWGDDDSGRGVRRLGLVAFHLRPLQQCCSF